MKPNGRDSINYQDRVLDGDRRIACSNAAKHTACPEGYLPWHAWALEKSKTHRSERCPGCGLAMLWVKKKKRRAA